MVDTTAYYYWLTLYKENKHIKNQFVRGFCYHNESLVTGIGVHNFIITSRASKKINNNIQQSFKSDLIRMRLIALCFDLFADIVAFSMKDDNV